MRGNSVDAEDPSHRPDSFDSPAAFQCLVPLSFIPEGSAFAQMPGPTDLDDRGTNHQALTVKQIERLIREAGCEPVERDTLYRPVARPT